MRNDFYIDGRGSGEFACRLLSSWSVGSPTLTRTRVQPSQGQRFHDVAMRCGLLPIKLPVHVFGRTPHDAALKESDLRAALLAGGAPVELFLPDGFFYTASLDSVTESTELGYDGCVRVLTFTLSGFRHGELQTQKCDVLTSTVTDYIQNSDGSITEETTILSYVPIYAEGNAPEMECRLTATVGAAASTYQMGTAFWVNVAAGDVLVVDGLNKTVTKNGQNAIGSCDIVNFAYLKPGENAITCPDALTVEYYPIFI